jgi:hypothetical protein
MHLPHISAVWNWRNEFNVSGKYSIYLRITLNRVSKYYTIEVPEKVRAEEWSGIEDVGLIIIILIPLSSVIRYRRNE